MAKKTNKELSEQVDSLELRLKQLDLLVQLLIQFLGKEVDFKKWLVDWQEEQKKKREQQPVIVSNKEVENAEANG